MRMLNKADFIYFFNIGMYFGSKNSFVILMSFFNKYNTTSLHKYSDDKDGKMYNGNRRYFFFQMGIAFVFNMSGNYVIVLFDVIARYQ